jgi:hypothetical protein
MRAAPVRVTAAPAPADASAPPVPRDRDVVVSREPAAAAHGVRQVPGDTQLTATSREEAVRLARAFARAHGVDVWYREGQTYHLLEAFRRASVRR